VHSTGRHPHELMCAAHLSCVATTSITMRVSAIRLSRFSQYPSHQIVIVQCENADGIGVSAINHRTKAHFRKSSLLRLRC
jgi:hypothetical protein